MIPGVPVPENSISKSPVTQFPDAHDGHYADKKY